MRLITQCRLSLAPLALGLLMLQGGGMALGEDRSRVDFNRDIRPILSENCFFCHGPDGQHREADLRLDTRDGLFADRDGTPAVVPGRAEASELFLRVSNPDDDLRMPPADTGKALSAGQIELLRQWIDQGADWREHWAYVPPERPRVPDVANAAWPSGAIDRFVLHRLEREKLTPSAEADRRTLIRRLSFDLTGLPPAPDEVEAFVHDPNPAAWERLIERLLAAPHFGERMAIHWLDLVRYADTVGYHGDQEHHISPYRDYVIQSFNDNRPFDRFTVEQLAGDLLESEIRGQRSEVRRQGTGVRGQESGGRGQESGGRSQTTDDGPRTTDKSTTHHSPLNPSPLIATGYNRVLQTSHEGGVQVKEYLAKYAADRVRNASSVWMGATLGCAECHDHKYDPFTQRDFYSLAAFFADVDDLQTFRGRDASPTPRAPEMPAWNLAQYGELRHIAWQIAALNAQRAAADAEADEIDQQIAALEQREAALRDEFRPTMITVSIEPRTMRILPRGDWLDDSGEEVAPAVPHFLRPIETDGRATRLDLARWFVSRDNPLTARVFVNRLWKMYFGVGLSRSLDDFGAQGEPPVHPELLDWLAVEFIDSGWDVKHIVRLMVASQTYRQSSLPRPELRQRDPENRLLARQSRWRLEAESVRDNALAVSGLLVRKLGGPSARPYQPDGYYRHLNFPKRSYKHDTDASQYRRGLYMHWQRVFLHPMLKAFDAPSREECTAERPVSNTPLASLVLLNDPSFIEAARSFAARILREGGASIDDRLRWAWQEALSRAPTDAELAVLRELVEHDLTDYTADPPAARQLLGVGLAAAPKELDVAELAAWTAAARAILNLNETITRN